MRPPISVNFSINFVIALTALLVGGGVMLAYGVDNAALHTMLDTSVALTGALIALLFWDISRRTDDALPLLLAITFALVAVGDVVHLLAALGWLRWTIGEGSAEVQWRAGTWGPPAHLLAIGVGAALLVRRSPRMTAWLYAAGLLLCVLLLIWLFLGLPRYTAPNVLGITRPSLILVPFLWIAVGAGYWRSRKESQIAYAIAFTAVILTLAHLAMLYSRAPSDAPAMVAHAGKFFGDALLLFSLMQIGAADTVRRRFAEQQLTTLNRDLDARVREQTAQLRLANDDLLAEMAERRKASGLLQAVTENTPAVIYVKDLAGRYLMVNRRYTELFHIDSETILGKTDYDVFTKEQADAFGAMDKRVLLAGHALTEEEVAPHDDGLHTYISVKAPLRDADGRPSAVFGVSTDITDVKRAKEALEESEERSRLIIATALDAVVGIEATGIITAWNAQAEQIFGWTATEAIGRLIDETIMPLRSRDAHRQGLARFIATGEARVLNRLIELTALHRDGHEFPVEIAITPLRSGGAIGFSAFIRDITERKAAEARVQAQIDRLHLLDNITRSIGQRHDVRSIFQVVVRSLEDQLPADFVSVLTYDRLSHTLTVAHVGGRSAALGRELGMIERAQVPIDENGLSRCVRGQLVYEPDISAVAFPFPERLASRGLRSLVVTPLTVEDEVFGVLVVSRDAPDSFLSTDCEFLKQLGEHVALAAHQTRLRDSLQQAYDDLRQTQQAVLQQERLRAIGQMASGIAHDINNAISPVAVYTQSLLEREPALSSRVRGYLDTVNRVVKDVSATVGRMRDFYRRDDDDSELKPVSLNELVPQVVDLTQARWSDMPQQRGIAIRVSSELETDLPLVLGNAAELREALTNLMFNAVDAMPQGGTITVRTQTSAPPAKKRVVLEVGDTGVGMTEEIRKRCLEPFFTTKGERGTGLGLAMVFGAAQRHKAYLDVESAPSAGTRVSLSFDPVESMIDPPQRHLVTVPPLRLLLVDDDPAVLDSTRDVLELDGHAVVAADGGAAGIEAMRTARTEGKTFDVIITDLGMPYVDGNAVARSAKELHPSATVVMLTGWGKRMNNRNDPPAHVDVVLPKPLDLDDLRAVFLQTTAANL